VSALKHLLPTKNKRDDHGASLNLDGIPGIDVLTAEEAHAFFDQKARETLGISGDEFLRRWDDGEYQPVPDETAEDRKIGHLAMLIPFARPTSN
jgi:hypothetical protein